MTENNRKMHSLFKRQLKRYFGESFVIPEQWREFMEAVDATYKEFDADRTLLEHSLELSSQELLQANSEMRAIFQALPDSLFRLSYDGTILDCKTGTTTNLYLPLKELIGKRIQDVPLENVGDKFLEAIHQVRENQSMASIEYSLNINDKETYYEARLLPLLENQIVALIRNSTAQKWAEEAVREQRMISETILEQSLSGYWDWNVKNGTEYLSPSLKKMLGYENHELLNTPETWVTLIHPDDLHIVKETFRKYVKSNGNIPYNYEVRYRHKNGSIVWVYCAGKAIEWNGEGRAVRMIGCHIDITERKKAEEEREKLQAQLLQSQKMEAVGTLAGGIAHDFNNLLTAIIGYSDLILSELPEKHSVKDKIRIVRDAGDKASDLVRQLLAFSRSQMLEMKPVNLNEIVWNMNKIFGGTIGEDIELELNINKPVNNVLADAGQIEQVLMNLVVNARDAMPNGGRLTIETDNIYLDETYALMHSQLVKPGPYVTLSVTDNGAGMSHEITKKIFEPFFTTKETGRGTGLGLSTTYGIIEQHNGYVWVYSEPGKGTTFKVYLPTIEEEAKEIIKDELSITGEGTETILVVDDQPLIRQFVIDVLQPLGYRLYEADSAEGALEIAEQVKGKIDLLLTDIVMPGMKGSELRKLFIEKWPGIKVCLMTGYGDKDILVDSMDDIIFIQKPLTPGKLSTKLREILDSKID